MNKDAAQKLDVAAWNVAELYSSDREFNFAKEKFSVEQIFPLSDDLAAVVYVKSGGKKSLAIFFHVKMNGGAWRHFFPTDSHLLGLMELQRLGLKQRVELENFGYNFVVQQ